MLTSITLALSAVLAGPGAVLPTAQRSSTPFAPRPAVTSALRIVPGATARGSQQRTVSFGERSEPGRTGPRFVDTNRGPMRLVPKPRAVSEKYDVSDLAPDLGLVPAPSATAGSVQIVSAATVPGGSAYGGSSVMFFQVRLNPGTGFQETFIVFAPAFQGQPAPMLVGFHKFSNSPLDIIQNTSFIPEAWSRGWYGVAPLGASGASFSSLESQQNTEAVLNWMVSNFNVDTDRVYGVGFSMGGGNATNYAARHVDPAGVMFAALVNHTGGIDLNNSYLNEPATRFVFDFWYGDSSPGSADQWQMTRSSVLRFDPGSLIVYPDEDLARNLQHIPTQIYRADNDPKIYLTVQCDVLASHLGAFRGGTNADYRIVSANQHEWGTLHEKQACDWLSQFSLQIPTTSSTLADVDGVYFHFLVEQDVPNVFTPFDWTVDDVANSVSITQTANLQKITVDTLGAGLDPTQALTVDVGTKDSMPDEVVLTGYTVLPTSVTRDAVPEVSWSYDGGAGTVTLSEYDGGAHTWVVTP